MLDEAVKCGYTRHGKADNCCDVEKYMYGQLLLGFNREYIWSSGLERHVYRGDPKKPMPKAVFYILFFNIEENNTALLFKKKS